MDVASRERHVMSRFLVELRQAWLCLQREAPPSEKLHRPLVILSIKALSTFVDS